MFGTNEVQRSLNEAAEVSAEGSMISARPLALISVLRTEVMAAPISPATPGSGDMLDPSCSLTVWSRSWTVLPQASY